MPKVTSEYLSEKKGFILECTREILLEKPLYMVSMRDIIKKAGFSQGAIYRYYAGVEEIFIDFINQNTTTYPLEQSIDALLASKRTERKILSGCIIAMGEYIRSLLETVGGRTCFELIVLYAYDAEKRAEIFPRLRFKQSLEYAERKTVEYAAGKIESGVLTPRVPMKTIVMFIGNFIDGVAQNAATHTAKENGGSDISLQFQLLAEAVISFMEVE